MRFWVGGAPQSKGSWGVVHNKRTGKPRLIPQNKGEPSWSQAVGWKARSVLRGTKPLDGPCELRVTLHIAKPKTTKFSYPVRPDGDKALRSIADALSGIAYLDDRQCVDMRVRKVWAGKDGPGADIEFEPLRCVRDVPGWHCCCCCDCVAERAGV